MDTKTTLKKALAEKDTDTLVDLNDLAVNTIREYCRDNGYDAGRLYTEETQRIVRGRMSLETYKATRRIGSTFRLSRVMRVHLWTAVRTRKALRELLGY